MGSSHASDIVPALRPLCEVQTTEPLVLRDMFPSRSLLLQYINGILCSDGSVGINNKGPQRFEAIVRICQSNLAFLTAINKEFDNTGYIRQHSAAGTRLDVEEGRYSNGELRQALTFYGEAAVKVAAELAPFTVTKSQHFQVLFDMQNQRKGLLTNSKYLDSIHTLNSHPEDSILIVKNITAPWLAGMFDGDGGITVPHNEKAGRSRLELNITQAKSPALLKAIQALYQGTIVTNPHRIKWVAADAIPVFYKALGSYLIMKKQKLNTLLQHLFKVDITKDPIADTVIDMPTEQEVIVQIEDGTEYPAILFGGRLDVDVLKDQLAQDGLILSKLDGKIPYRNGNGLSRTKFTATTIKAQTVRRPGRKSAQAYPPAKNQWWLLSLVQ
ncbi:TPA: hypothetical protein ACH3X2_005131 [Trebouxia sp. C0005]|nr:MAG: hypothetical protein FRX49_09942 [Trebouxia sp. A1-2]